MDQIIHSLIKNEIFNDQVNLIGRLIDMSRDPEIQIELKKINNEFGLTESDKFDAEWLFYRGEILNTVNLRT